VGSRKAAEKQQQKQQIGSAFVGRLVAKKRAKRQLAAPREAGPVSRSGSTSQPSTIPAVMQQLLPPNEILDAFCTHHT